MSARSYQFNSNQTSSIAMAVASPPPMHSVARPFFLPRACSGARIIVTLLHALQARGKKKGLATLCIGGGEATAMAIELV